MPVQSRSCLPKLYPLAYPLNLMDLPRNSFTKVSLSGHFELQVKWPGKHYETIEVFDRTADFYAWHDEHGPMESYLGVSRESFRVRLLECVQQNKERYHDAQFAAYEARQATKAASPS